MPEIISKKEARRQYKKLTGLDNFRSSYRKPEIGSGLQFISADSEKEANSIQNRIPDSCAARRRRQGSGFEVAIYEKPETREEARNIRSKLRDRWGSLR